MDNINSFANQDLFVGIDMHKKNWRIGVISEFAEFKPLTIDPNPDVLSCYLNTHFPGGNYLAAYEAGFCGFQPCKSLTALGIPCIVVHPADVPTTDKEKKRKSDPVDCKKIARALRSGQLQGIHVPGENQLLDRALLRHREQLVKDQTRCKNRIKGYLSAHWIDLQIGSGNYWSRAFLAQLEKVARWHPAMASMLQQLSQIRTLVRLVTRQLVQIGKERYKQNIALLRSVPGIGMLTAITLAIEIGDIRRFTRFDQFAAFIGLIPNAHESGDTKRGGRITSRGKKLIKKYIIEASWIAIRTDPELMARFNTLARRMSRNRAIIRIAKSLLSRIKAVLERGQPYQINYNLSRS